MTRFPAKLATWWILPPPPFISLAIGQNPLQELEVGPLSEPYLLVGLNHNLFQVNKMTRTNVVRSLSQGNVPEHIYQHYL